MGESLYGKFGVSVVKAGIISLFIVVFVTLMAGFFLSESNITLLFGLVFLIIIVGIVLGIVGTIKDDLREKAIRALIAGIIFLIMGIVLYFLYITYLRPLFGL